MKKLASFFFTLAFLVQPAHAQEVNGKYAPGFYAPTNYVKNWNCQFNDRNITDASTILSAGGSGLLNGARSCALDASADDQVVKFDQNAFDAAVYGQDCEARLTYTGDGSLYKAYVQNDSTTISQEVQLVNTGSDSRTVSMNYPCGSGSGSTRPVIESTSASAAAIKISGVYSGLATNLGSVVQARDLGSATWSSQSNCMWQSTATSFTNFADDTDCTTPTLTGLAGAVNSGDTLAITVPSHGPGVYEVELSSYMGCVTTASDATTNFCSYRMTDSTVNSNAIQQGYDHATTGIKQFASPGGKFRFVYTSPPSSSTITFRVQANIVSGNRRAEVDARASDVQLRVKYYPSSAQTAIKADQTNYGWTSAGLTTSDFIGFGTVSNIECLQKRDGEDLLFNCKFTSGTSTATEARVDLPGSLISAGTDRIPSIKKVGSGSKSPTSANVIAVLAEPSVSYVTFSIQDASGGLTKVNGSSLLSSTNVFSFEARIPIAGWLENQKAPILVGSVTSGTSGAERIERASITNTAGTWSISSQSGTWLASFTDNGVGLVSLNFTAGTWSGVPSCVCSVQANAAFRGCQTGANSTATTTSLVSVGIYADTGSASEQSFDIICMGPR